jgi:hypothetical protein
MRAWLAFARRNAERIRLAAVTAVACGTRTHDVCHRRPRIPEAGQISGTNVGCLATQRVLVATIVDDTVCAGARDVRFSGLVMMRVRRRAIKVRTKRIRDAAVGLGARVGHARDRRLERKVRKEEMKRE